MSSPKFPGGSDFVRTAAVYPVSALASTSSSTASSARSGGSTDNAQLKAAFFEQSGIHVHIRKGPIPRMPLRAAKPNRLRVARGAGRVGSHEDEPDSDIPDDEVAAEEGLKRIPAGFESRDDSEGRHKQDGGDRDERRLKKLFSMAAAPSVPTGSVTIGAGTITARARSLNPSPAVTLAPLPELHSLRDVLHLIQSTSLADPSGKSVPLLLRRINAAVLQNKIDLPKISKVADTRELLIDIFGKGHQNPSTLSASQRSLHAMLPLWLLNLGRQRTPTQQSHAAARLSLPRTDYLTAAAAA